MCRNIVGLAVDVAVLEYLSDSCSGDYLLLVQKTKQPQRNFVVYTYFSIVYC